MYDVVIIGGGVVGCAIARQLSRYRLRVAVLERCAEVGFGTTKTNSGIIHAGHQSPPDTLKGRLSVRGNELFDTLQQELSFGFRRIGELVVAQREKDLPVLDRLKEQGEAKGVPGLEIWDRKRLRREEPNLSRALLGALHAPTAGVINPYEFAFALIENAVGNGVDLVVDAPAEKLDTGPDGITVHTPKGAFPARFVINCAGLAPSARALSSSRHSTAPSWSAPRPRTPTTGTMSRPPPPEPPRYSTSSAGSAQRSARETPSQNSPACAR
jgi:glycerol-3-phosphate dehydrogenase